MRKIVIIGRGQIASTVADYIESWGIGHVCAFSVDRDYVGNGCFMGLPVIDMEELPSRYPPGEYSVFVGVGYQEMNAFRTRKVKQAKAAGYSLISVVNPDVPGSLEVGENSLVVPGKAFLEPNVRIGNNVSIWNAVSISHYVEIADNCWISNGTCIGGNVCIGQDCFVGLGVIVNNKVRIGRACLIGSGSLITKDLVDETAVIPSATLPASFSARYARALLT